ncbi:hypothetical protein HK405_006087 [Cladochytrium tenue]|nr:hypothetical protein HK405_006087 [Cladochytrium tenue]
MATRILKSAHTFYVGMASNIVQCRYTCFADEAGLLANTHFQRAVAFVPSILTDALKDDDDAPYNDEALSARIPNMLESQRDNPFRAADDAVTAATALHQIRIDFLLDQLRRRDGEPLSPAAAAVAAAATATTPPDSLRPLDDAALAALVDAGATHPADALLAVDHVAAARLAARIDKAAAAAPVGPHGSRPRPVSAPTTPALASATELLEILKVDLSNEAAAATASDAAGAGHAAPAPLAPPVESFGSHVLTVDSSVARNPPTYVE